MAAAKKPAPKRNRQTAEERDRQMGGSIRRFLADRVEAGETLVVFVQKGGGKDAPQGPPKETLYRVALGQGASQWVKTLKEAFHQNEQRLDRDPEYIDRLEQEAASLAQQNAQMNQALQQIQRQNAAKQAEVEAAATADEPED